MNDSPEQPSNTQRIEFDVLPPDPERLIVCDWFRQHGIDPDDVAVPGWMELRHDEKQIAYEAYVIDPHDGGILLNAARDDGVRETKVVQLEAAPRPFPLPLPFPAVDV